MTRILVVDDKEENRYYLETLLGASGFTVEAVSDGEAALAAARRTLPDLAVSDLLMPQMDGYELLRAWKADERLRSIPFVVYTATYLEAEDEHLALGLGADAFIVKPVEPDAFLARVRAVLEQRGTPSAPRLRPTETPDLLKRHTDSLIRKLDEKTAELESANQKLREDVKRREQVEKSLREREALLRIAGRAARLGGWSFTAGATRVVWSDEVCAIFEEPPGTSPTPEQAIEYCAPEYREAFRARLEACLSGGAAFDEELQITTAGGRRVWVRAIGRAEQDAAGRVIRVHGALQDIDERRKLEQQYHQAQKMEVVGRLAGGVAHDFNNLLTIINGYAELLLDALEPGHTGRGMLETILRAGQRSATLTRQLLAFSRNDVAAPKVVSLNDIVKAVEKMLRRIIGEDLVLTLKLAPDLGRARLDEAQIDQILMNLAVNARDAMPDGGSLTIETANVEVDGRFPGITGAPRGGPHVALCVSDTGTGMPPEVRDRIFEPFFTTKPVGRGTGLGLSVVLGIVQQHNGHIRVYSEPGVGTTFKIFWPRLDGPADVAAHPTAREGHHGGHETILIVEDDDLVRAFARSALERFGYEVLEAESPSAALRLAGNPGQRFHAVVTDVVMPGMGGRQLAQELQRLQPGVKVLFVSGYTEDAVVRHGFLSDAKDFLNKPFSAHALARKVRALLDG